MVVVVIPKSPVRLFYSMLVKILLILGETSLCCYYEKRNVLISLIVLGMIRVDNFWPWVNNKAENTSLYYGTQHFRSGTNIAAPRDGVPSDTDDAATDTITDSEAAAIPDTVGKLPYCVSCFFSFLTR